MSYAYSPGLKVKRTMLVRKTRVLPVSGDVLVTEGSHVSYDTVVARTYVPGDVTMVPLFYNVGVEPYELPKVMLKKEGDTVKEGELLAVSKAFFGLFKTEYKSEVSGTIELISTVTGMVAIQGLPRPVNLSSYISGKVVEVIPKLGVVIETPAAFFQGILGIGGERHGELKTVASPDEVLTPNVIGEDCAGKVLMGGSLVTAEVLKKAEDAGVRGIITGGIDSGELTSYLEYEMGVAITGNEDIGLTCIITEGFGKMTMASRTYNLLKDLEGMLASINGATQIRAGVIRPEVIVPLMETSEAGLKMDEEDVLADGMYPGTRVRIIRQPYFGAIGTIHSLPVELQQMESESYVRVMVVNLDEGSQVTIPRANTEIIEE
ncbi:MAG: hypothetical protein NWF13_00250 [Candidatus Bathyarchaeota archaeon]|nr:hypothetical protein [Candidatus Bathyarchaeota archaeon]